MINSVQGGSLGVYPAMRTLTQTGQGIGVGLNSYGSTTKSPTSIDFSNMTRNELRDWANEQVKCGKISLDECMTFGAMTMAIPVSGNAMQDDVLMNTKTNFFEKADTGIQGAISRNDSSVVLQLQTALDIMKDHQKKIDFMV